MTKSSNAERLGGHLIHGTITMGSEIFHEENKKSNEAGFQIGASLASSIFTKLMVEVVFIVVMHFYHEMAAPESSIRNESNQG